MPGDKPVRVKAKFALPLAGIIIFAVFVLLVLGYVFIFRPPASFPSGTIITIPEGATLWQAGLELEQDNIVRSARAFDYLIILLGQERNIEAGDYMFKNPLDIFQIALRLIRGERGITVEPIKVIEGSTVKQISGLFSKDFYKFNKDEFLQISSPKEGYLFPDTYFFTLDATAAEAEQMMENNFSAKIKPLEPEIASSSHSLSDIITMASILEREAPTVEDMKIISGILWKRIKIGMPLQVDSTITYITGKSDGELTVDDLNIDSPYDLFIHKGLPPGPIANPGLASIEAALNPTPSKYLFFLSDKNRVMHYAATFAGHEANINTYLR